MNEDWLATWDALEERERSQILKALKPEADQQAVVARDLYASNFTDAPKLEIRGCTREGTVLRIVYLFAWWEWCAAQSGSDWNYHKVYSGIAVFDGLKLRSNEMTERRNDYVHEYEEKNYDAAAALQAVREALANSI